MTTRSSERPPIDPDTVVKVRRHWNDWKIGTARLGDLSGFRWDQVSGGHGSVSPKPMVHAYVTCTDVVGEFGHSGSHGPCPHLIKVVLTKKDNDPKITKAVRALADAEKARRSAS